MDKPTRTVVAIPCTVWVAVEEDGTCSEMTLDPGMAPQAWHHDGPKLDLEDVEGPFWKAVQARLEVNPNVEWVE